MSRYWRFLPSKRVKTDHSSGGNTMPRPVTEERRSQRRLLLSVEVYRSVKINCTTALPAGDDRMPITGWAGEGRRLSGVACVCVSWSVKRDRVAGLTELEQLWHEASWRRLSVRLLIPSTNTSIEPPRKLVEPSSVTICALPWPEWKCSTRKTQDLENELRTWKMHRVDACKWSGLPFSSPEIWSVVIFQVLRFPGTCMLFCGRSFHHEIPF